MAAFYCVVLLALLSSCFGEVVEEIHDGKKIIAVYNGTQKYFISPCKICETFITKFIPLLQGNEEPVDIMVTAACDAAGAALLPIAEGVIAALCMTFAGPAINKIIEALNHGNDDPKNVCNLIHIC